MQIRALYDNQGRILAAAHLDSPKTAGSTVPVPQPQAKRGQRVGTFTVPEEHRHFGFPQVCVELMVKGKGERATLALKPREGRGKN
jgi:hypothetical protein